MNLTKLASLIANQEGKMYYIIYYLLFTVGFLFGGLVASDLYFCGKAKLSVKEFFAVLVCSLFWPLFLIQYFLFKRC